MTSWDRGSLGSRIDRLIVDSYPAKWLRSRSQSMPPVFKGRRRLWPAALILVAAPILAALAWTGSPDIPTRASIPALASCMVIATFSRSLCEGHSLGTLRRTRLDEREQAVRREAYARTYATLALLGALGIFALMIEALASTTSRQAIGQHAAVIMLLGSTVLSALPVLLEAAQHRLSEDPI